MTKGLVDIFLILSFEIDFSGLAKRSRDAIALFTAIYKQNAVIS